MGRSSSATGLRIQSNRLSPLRECALRGAAEALNTARPRNLTECSVAIDTRIWYQFSKHSTSRIHTVIVAKAHSTTQFRAQGSNSSNQCCPSQVPSLNQLKQTSQTRSKRRFRFCDASSAQESALDCCLRDKPCSSPHRRPFRAMRCVWC